MESVSAAFRTRAREALLVSGGRGFVRFGAADGALLVSDVCRRAADPMQKKAMQQALFDAGFTCREENGLWQIDPTDALLAEMLGGAWQGTVDWAGTLCPVQALALRLAKDERLPLTEGGRRLVLETLRLLWLDEAHVLSGMDDLRARAAILQSIHDRSGRCESGAALHLWCEMQKRAEGSKRKEM